MRYFSIFFTIALLAISASAAVITCVNEGSNVVRIDYSATDETSLPKSFALDVSVDGGATITSVSGFKTGDSNSTSRGYGIFPASIEFDENGAVSNWGSPAVAGVGTATVTLGLASRYSGTANAPLVSGTLCRVAVNAVGTTNIKVALNSAGGGIILESGTAAKFTGVGVVLGSGAPPPVLTAPAAPASIGYPATSSTGTYTVSWSASTGATSYQVERSNNAGGTWTQIYSGANLTYPQTVANGSYIYHVRATNTAGSSGWRAGTACVVTIASTKVPAAPAKLSYPTSSNGGRYTITWSSSTGATTYRLERSRNGSSTWTRIYSGANRSYSERVTSNGTYRYRVGASNTAGSSSWKTGTSSCRVSIRTGGDDGGGSRSNSSGSEHDD